MNCTICSRWLHDYVDGYLTVEESRFYESHLAACPEGPDEITSLRRLRALTSELPQEIDPSRDLWAGLKVQITSSADPVEETTPAAAMVRPSRTQLETTRPNPPQLLRWFAPLAMAATIAILATFAERTIVPRNPAGWSVAALSGTPRVDARDVRDETKMRVGQWLVTDESARAKVVVGSIGEVSLEPNSRLRLVGMAAANHRLELARGTLNAMIWAPPRLFFVDTPSATAVDLGCAYTLKVDDDGNGELHVTTGFVSLEDRGREAILRTGMMCYTRRGIGPGTPFAVDAPEALRAALTRFDFESGNRDAALRDVLAQARADDSITLWHLLDRTKDRLRASVFDLLAQYSPPPAGVTREGVVGGDPVMRRAWGTHMGIDRF